MNANDTPKETHQMTNNELGFNEDELQPITEFAIADVFMIDNRSFKVIDVRQDSKMVCIRRYDSNGYFDTHPKWVNMAEITNNVLDVENF